VLFQTVSNTFLVEMRFSSRIKSITRYLAIVIDKLSGKRVRIARFFAFLAASLAVSAVFSPTHADADSTAVQLQRRLDEARRLVAEAGVHLEALTGDVAQLGLATSGQAASYSSADSGIWREVRLEKRRRAELEAAFEYRRASLGYTFNPNLVLGMNSTAWHGDFGLKLDGRVSLITQRRAVGANLSLLYAMHQFYLTGEEMYTRLYLFGGSGFYWERIRDGSGGWFNLPDQAIRSQFGAGTELGLKEMHGTRFTPEIGFQYSRFIARHQESSDYSGDRPRSDFSLYPYYALHINFYFL
jgi:hypothetical protein